VSPETGEDAASDERRGSKPLLKARRALKSALAEAWHGSAEKRERIAGTVRSLRFFGI
jgi:hypothetical protein